MSSKRESSRNPQFFEQLWENWQAESGGAGRCAGCPAHWSIRSDFPGEPGKREGSFEHRPLFGEGDLSADIAVFGMEPGKPTGFDESQNRRTQSFQDVRHEEVNGGGGTIANADPLFNVINESEFSQYYSQIKKCNEIRGNKEANDIAFSQCAGLNENIGYLEDEIAVVNPEAVVPFGKRALQVLTKLFDLEPLGPDNYTKELTKGKLRSGLRFIESRDPDVNFQVYPVAHPNTQGNWQVWKNLDIETTEEYYDQFGKDLVKSIK